MVEYTYTLGAAGERVKVEETGAASDRTVEYEYDALYRLVKETVTDSNGTTVTEYTYDRNSNRLTKTVDGDVISYAYNELNQLVSETGITYEYDLNGNLIKKTEADKTTVYTYNAQNRLIRVTIQSGQQVNVEEYLYDYAGNRIAKVTELGSTYYLVDTNGALSQVLSEYDENSSLTTLYTRGDELILQERNGVKSYYLYDGFDSVRMLTDEGGSVTDTYTFDAFGNLTDSTGETENSYLYRGEQYDSFTGLYYLRARYMNPSTGTFITMDEYAGSVFEPVSLHKYLYANSNPVMNSDPTGYYSVASLVAGSAGMAEIAAAYATASVAAACAAIKLFNTILDISFNVIVQTTLINLQFTILTATDANYSVATMDMIVQNMFDSLRTIVDKKVDLTEDISYTVYGLREPGGEKSIRYIGRTRHLSRRLEQHSHGKNSHLIYDGDSISNLTYAQSRALEQTLMVYYHTRNWLQENGNNSINGISEKNGNKKSYFNALKDLLENEADNELLCFREDMNLWW